LSENPPEKVNLVFVATGAEEDGLAGAMRYIQKYSQDFDPKRSFFVNYDGVGAEGKITITTKYGIPPTIASRKLSELAIKIASQKGIKASEGYVPIGAGFDQFPIAARGFETVTISSGKFGPAILSIHSSHDCLENVSLEALQKTGDIGFELAEQIRCLG
jgi:Zn-dependent M28 family amino/carboxypeptidase